MTTTAAADQLLPWTFFDIADDATEFFSSMELDALDDDDDVFELQTTHAVPAAGPPHSTQRYILTVSQVRLTHVSLGLMVLITPRIISVMF